MRLGAGKLGSISHARCQHCRRFFAQGDDCRLYQSDEAARDSAAAWGHAGGDGGCHRRYAWAGPDTGDADRWSVGGGQRQCDQLLLGPRHRPAYDAHQVAHAAGWSRAGDACADLRRKPRRHLVHHLRRLRQSAQRVAGAFCHSLLRPHLHDVAQAHNHAEHRHRRRGGRGARPHRLGGGDAHDWLAGGMDVHDYLPLDTTTLLGALAGAEERLCAGNVPMLPVVRGENETYKQIILYTVLLVAASLTLFVMHAMGLLYLVGALALGGGLLGLSIWLAMTRTLKNARTVFWF